MSLSYDVSGLDVYVSLIAGQGDMNLRLLHDASNLLLVSLEADNQVLLERAHAVSEKARAVQQIADDKGLVDVQLKLTVHSTNRGGDVVTHDLGADHGEGLALGGVDLAGHDAATRLVLRQVELTETATRAAAEVTDILGNLGQRAGKSVEASMSLNNGIVGGKSLELVGSGLELGAGHLADLLSNSLGEALEGVNTSANCGTALGEQAQVGQGALDALDAVVELGNVAGELLGKGQGSGILQVRTSNLDDLLGLKVVDLGLKSIAQAVKGGEELVLDLEDGSDVHDGREGVVGGSGSVDVVVGVDGLLATHLAAEDLNGTVRDDLVGVHVGLGAGAGLPDNEGEVVEELAIGDLLGGLLNSLADLLIYWTPTLAS